MTAKRLPVLGSVVRLITKVFSTFLATSWKTWRTLLTAAFEGLDALDDDQRDLI